MKFAGPFLCALIGSTALALPALADCAGLTAGKFSDTEIKSAEQVAAGALNPSDLSGAPKQIFNNLPGFCRIAGIIRPTADSEIGFEIWLPDKWNGRYLQVGNGGFGGLINYGALVPGLRNGFAVASTDDGHNGAGASWAIGHPEKFIDFGYRALHLTSVVAREIVAKLYDRKQSYSYFSGCSDGGRESLMEAQRYPDDFDGWVVGAPANDWTGMMAYMLSVSQIAAALNEPLSPAQLAALDKAALAQCDASDGVTDGIIDQPLKCRFDPARLLCKGGQNDGNCLSQAQVNAVKAIDDDTRDAKTHASLAPGFRAALGDMTRQWTQWVGDGKTGAFKSFNDNYWPFMVYGDPNFDWHKLDARRAAEDARLRTGTILNALDPNLSAIRAAGKKIIQYHGSADAVISPEYSIRYYEAVEKYLSQDNRDFYRLFLAPGVEHCGGGPGPNAFGSPFDPRPFGSGYDPLHDFDPDRNVLAALVEWVEHGKAPQKIVATKFRNDDATAPIERTRPLCLYPSVEKWTGKGSTDDAGNFVCSKTP